MSRRVRPPAPQHEDKRVFAPGTRVEARWTFSQGCPPGPNSIAQGSAGTVTGAPVVRDDRPFEPKRMVPVRWDSGLSGEVVDRLLVQVLP